jgi:isoleucyl-tRNA synthetase
MSFTCEEVWGYLPGKRTQTVHAAQFPDRGDVLGSAEVGDDAKQLEDWSTLLLVRDQVLKALETARNSKLIGKSLEAQVSIAAAEPVYSVLERHRGQLRYLFIVSAVTLENRASENGAANVAVQVEKAAGRKCDRCWNYSTRVGEDPVYPTVCERCSAVLKEIEAAATVG